MSLLSRRPLTDSPRRVVEMQQIASWLERIDDIAGKLEQLARPLAGLTEADPKSGEQWDAHEVWGHLAEFVEYWIEVFGEVIDQFAGEPIQYGRALDDSSRTAGLAHGRAMDFDRLWTEVQSDLSDLREFITLLPPSAESVVGIHPDGAKRTLEQMIDGYLVGHLEEHLAQLESLRT